MFSGFLGWCATKKDLRALVNKEAARASELGDVLPGVNKRRDALEIDQLPAWFAGTDKLRSRIAAAYLQALVLTGARREELAGLTWANVDFQWQKLTIADKVEATRVIPLTPYVAWLLAGLPRQNAMAVRRVVCSSPSRERRRGCTLAHRAASQSPAHRMPTCWPMLASRTFRFTGCAAPSRCWVKPQARQPVRLRK